MSPDIRRKVDAARANRLAREAELKKQIEAQVSSSISFSPGERAVGKITALTILLLARLHSFHHGFFELCYIVLRPSSFDQTPVLPEATKPIWAGAPPPGSK